MNLTPITGGCYCAAVRFTVAPGSVSRTNCHCANCRRAVGAQAVAWITAKRKRFRWEKADPVRYLTETGAWRTFCGVCGTSLTYEIDSRPEHIDITVGSLDRPEDFPPAKDLYPEERVTWVPLMDQAGK